MVSTSSSSSKEGWNIMILCELSEVDCYHKDIAYLLSKIDDILEYLANTRYFSTTDLVSGYWQVQIYELYQERTVFATYLRIFEWKVLLME
jgi:hypothetical protein